MFTKVKNFIFILALALIIVNTVNIVLKGFDNAKEYNLTTMLQTLNNSQKREYQADHIAFQGDYFWQDLKGAIKFAFNNNDLVRGVRIISNAFERLGQYTVIIIRFVNNFFALF